MRTKTWGIKQKTRNILREEISRIEKAQAGGPLSKEHLECVQLIIRTYHILETKLPSLDLPLKKDKWEGADTKTLVEVLKNSNK